MHLRKANNRRQTTIHASILNPNRLDLDPTELKPRTEHVLHPEHHLQPDEHDQIQAGDVERGRVPLFQKVRGCGGCGVRAP